RQQLPALRRAHGEAGKIIVAGLIDARHFRGLAPDQGAAGLAAGARDAADDGGTDLRIELSTGEIVEEEQRFGALHHEIVDGHRDDVDTDRVVVRGINRQLDLGAYTVRGGDQD